MSNIYLSLAANSFVFLRFSDIFKPYNGLAVNLNQIFPHGERTNPRPTLTVKSFVNNHIIKGFALLGKPDNFVMIAFIVAIYAER
jgi:hypothetical protein